MTFDNKRYQFCGTCNYMLVRDNCANNSETFSIQAKNVPCGTGGVTCTKSITINLNGTQISLDQGREPLFRSMIKNKSEFTVEKSGLYIIFRTNTGISIVWDFGTRIYITLDNRYRGLYQYLHLFPSI